MSNRRYVERNLLLPFPAISIARPFDVSKITEADGHYIAGLVDGEGSFVLYLKTDSRKRGGLFIQTEFTLQLRIDDAAIIHWMKSIFGVGRIHNDPNRKCPMCRLSIASRVDCWNVLLPFFDRFQLRAKKKNDYVIWRQAVELAYTVFLRKRPKKPGRNGWGPKWTEEEKKGNYILDSSKPIG